MKPNSLLGMGLLIAAKTLAELGMVLAAQIPSPPRRA
jgi:hypothetical protein